MGGGGGGDPAAASRQQEAERQVRIQAATDEINRIFNNQVKQAGTRYVRGGDYNQYGQQSPAETISADEFAARQADYQQAVEKAKAKRSAASPFAAPARASRPSFFGSSLEENTPFRSVAAPVPSFFGSSLKENTPFRAGTGTIPVRRQDSETGYVNGFNPSEWRQESYDYWVDGPKVDAASGIVKDRAMLYDQQRKAVYDLNRLDVDRQAAEAERANRFGLARAGLLGGSANVDSIGDLDRRTNEGLMRAGGIADQASADLFSADERTRANLISLAQSGIDTGTAAQQALKGLEVNAANAAGARAGATVGDLFGSMSQAYLMNQMRQGQQAGMLPNSQQRFGVSNPRIGDSGSIT